MRPHKKFNPFPFEYHQELELTIDSLTNLGAGIARVTIEQTETTPEDAPKDWVIFVPFALPGEKVKARIFRNDKSHSQADLIEVLEPSPHRRRRTARTHGRHHPPRITSHPITSRMELQI